MYFAQSAVETGEDGTSEAIMVPAANFIGADAVSSTSTSFTFRNAYGKADAKHVIKLGHAANKNKDVIKAFMNAMNANPQKGGFIVMTDYETGTAKSANINPVFKGLGMVDGVAVDIAANDARVFANLGIFIFIYLIEVYPFQLKVVVFLHL